LHSKIASKKAGVFYFLPYLSFLGLPVSQRSVYWLSIRNNQLFLT